MLNKAIERIQQAEVSKSCNNAGTSRPLRTVQGNEVGFSVSQILTLWLGSWDCPPYIACFSPDCDSLSQWCMYANNATGFAVGFSVAKLEECCSTYKELDVGLKQVIYEKTDQDKLLDDTIRSCLDNQPNHQQAETDDKSEWDFLWRPYGKIWAMAAICKNPYFHQENEHRIIMMPNRRVDKDSGCTVADVGISEPRFRASGNRIIPYYEFPFPEEAITDVYLGPLNVARKNPATIKTLLRANGYAWNYIRAISSEIPYQSNGAA